MQLPATSYRHGYSRDRRGSNTSVSPHFLPLIPGWEVKTCHYAHLAAHCSVTNHPRGRIRQGPYPTISGIQPFPLGLDPAPVSKEERPTWHRTEGLFTVSSPTSPWCPGMAGHSWGTTLQPPPQESTNLHLKAPRCPGLLLSYKRAGPGSTRGKGRRTEQAPANKQTRLQLTDQHLKQSSLYSFVSLETWARFPLSQLVTPTQAPRCKEIQNSPP
jgi:hypothetical protein